MESNWRVNFIERLSTYLCTVIAVWMVVFDEVKIRIQNKNGRIGLATFWF